MIADPTCPRCWTPMVYDMGPALDPDPEYGVVIEEVHRCPSCGYEVAVHRDTWTDTEIRRAVVAHCAARGLHGAERDMALAEHGFTQGRRADL